MDKIFNWFSIVFGFLGGFFTYWLGGMGRASKTILFLAVVDYITGVIKAIYKKKLSSEIGFKGLLKKIVMFIVIAVAFAIQGLMGNTVPLKRDCYNVLHCKRSPEPFGECSRVYTSTR